MKKLLFLLPLIFLLSCSTAVRKTAYGLADGKVEWIFLHVNDVYEIAPLSGGKIGGLARVATLRRELMKENPNVITVMAGDFLNPSLIGTLKYEGSGIKGKQMVDVMNAVGFDYVCFGNHEFDLDFVDLQKRIDESNFTWLSSNAFKTEGEGIVAFGKSIDPDNNYIPEYKIITLKDGTANEMVKVGIIAFASVPAHQWVTGQQHGNRMSGRAGRTAQTMFSRAGAGAVSTSNQPASAAQSV